MKEFIKWFEKEYPRDTFETQAVYDDYRRTCNGAWRASYQATMQALRK
jgi:hypothetical protein